MAELHSLRGDKKLGRTFDGQSPVIGRWVSSRITPSPSKT